MFSETLLQCTIITIYMLNISSAKAHCADLPNVSYIVQASTQLEGRAEAVSRVCSSIEQSLILLGMCPHYGFYTYMCAGSSQFENKLAL